MLLFGSFEGRGCVSDQRRHYSWDREVQCQYDGITVGTERYSVSMTALRLGQRGTVSV